MSHLQTILNMNFNELQNSYLNDFESELQKAIKFSLNDDRKILEDAISYSVSSPGKRIRPLICMATEKSLTGNLSISKPISVAIELIHCYSLIHDDLPAMDDDDFRRGNPTCHKAFGEDMAILAGDVLNTYVFEYLAKELPKLTSFEKSLSIIKDFSNACGINGMAGGQVLDLKSEYSSSASIEDIQKIHQLKTGALLKLCFMIPTMTSTENESTISTMANIGNEFGILFQIIDDIIDETGDFNAIGKSPGKDALQNKLTYVSLLGLNGAKKEAKNHFNIGIRHIKSLPFLAEELITIFNYVYDKGDSA